MTKVYVVMGNDYPDSVHASQEGAENFIKTKKDDETAYREGLSRQHIHRPGIYWRWYEFEVQA